MKRLKLTLVRPAGQQGDVSDDITADIYAFPDEIFADKQNQFFDRLKTYDSWYSTGRMESFYAAHHDLEHKHYGSIWSYLIITDVDVPTVLEHNKTLPDGKRYVIEVSDHDGPLKRPRHPLQQAIDRAYDDYIRRHPEDTDNKSVQLRMDAKTWTTYWQKIAAPYSEYDNDKHGWRLIGPGYPKPFNLADPETEYSCHRPIVIDNSVSGFAFVKQAQKTAAPGTLLSSIF